MHFYQLSGDTQAKADSLLTSNAFSNGLGEGLKQVRLYGLWNPNAIIRNFQLQHAVPLRDAEQDVAFLLGEFNSIGDEVVQHSPELFGIQAYPHFPGGFM